MIMNYPMIAGSSCYINILSNMIKHLLVSLHQSITLWQERCCITLHFDRTRSKNILIESDVQHGAQKNQTKIENPDTGRTGFAS